MCDAKTVAEEDLVQVEAVLPPQGSGTFENVSKGGFSTWCCKSNPNHRWYCKCHLSHCLFVWAGGWGRGRTSMVPESGGIRPHSVHNGISIEVRILHYCTRSTRIENWANNVVDALPRVQSRASERTPQGDPNNSKTMPLLLRRCSAARSDPKISVHVHVR